MAYEVVLLEESASISDSVENARLVRGGAFDERQSRTLYTGVLEESLVRKYLPIA